VIGAITVLEAPVVFAGTTITPPALKRPRRETVDSSPPPARIAATGNPGSSNELSCIMDAPLSQSMDSVNTVACSNGEDENDECMYILSFLTAVQQIYSSDHYFSRELHEKSGVRIWEVEIYQSLNFGWNDEK
ncbi:hypothetical protein PV326_013225, partial [Microctonus aethiopoides]